MEEALNSRLSWMELDGPRLECRELGSSRLGWRELADSQPERIELGGSRLVRMNVGNSKIGERELGSFMLRVMTKFQVVRRYSRIHWFERGFRMKWRARRLQAGTEGRANITVSGSDGGRSAALG